MKNKMLIFITSLVIFAAAFFYNVASSYAYDSGYYSSLSFGLSNYTAGDKGIIAVWVDSSDYVYGYGFNVTYKYYSNVSTINGTFQIGVYKSDTSKYLTNGYFSSQAEAIAAYNNYSESSYDSSIAPDLEAWTVLEYPSDLSLYNLYLNMGCYFRSSSADHVDIFISGSKKSDTFTVSGNYGVQWINMSDYASPLGTVTVCFTPYDSEGNWGNTLVLSQLYSDVGSIKTLFNGYSNKVTNSSGITDIIGIQDSTVFTVEDKPTTSPPPVINPIKTIPVYVPVFQGDSESTVINEYITNNNVVNNTYNETNNIINVTTNISVNFDIDVNTVTENVNNIKTDIEDYSGIWVNLLNLFDMYFPFLNSVGALGVGLFISIIGIILVSIPVRILLHFIS